MAIVPGYPQVTAIHIALGFVVGIATYFIQSKFMGNQFAFSQGMLSKLESGTKHLIISLIVSVVVVTAVIATGLV